MAALWRADCDGLEVIGPGRGRSTRGVCGGDAKFRPTGSGELFALPELELPAAHDGLRVTQHTGKVFYVAGYQTMLREAGQA